MPYLGSTVFFASVVVTLALAMCAWFLALRALAPSFVERARERWRRPVSTVLFGAVSGGVLTIAAALLTSLGHPIAKLAGGAVATILLAVALSGAAGLAALVGRGLASPSDEGREWFQCLKGGAVLELTLLLPVFGWLVLAPIALYGGFGAAIIAGLEGLTARRPAVAGARAA